MALGYGLPPCNNKTSLHFYCPREPLPKAFEALRLGASDGNWQCLSPIIFLCQSLNFDVRFIVDSVYKLYVPNDNMALSPAAEKGFGNG